MQSLERPVRKYYKKEKTEVLKNLFSSIGENVSVGLPFICDYGCNISMESGEYFCRTYAFILKLSFHQSIPV